MSHHADVGLLPLAGAELCAPRARVLFAFRAGESGRPGASNGPTILCEKVGKECIRAAYDVPPLMYHSIMPLDYKVRCIPLQV